MDEPQDQEPVAWAAPDDSTAVPAWGQGAAGWAPPVLPDDGTAGASRRRRQRLALVVAGAAAVVGAVAAAVAVNASGGTAQPAAASVTSSAASGDAAVALSSQAATVSQNTVSSGDPSAQAQPSGDPCLSSLTSLTNMMTALGNDILNASKSSADVQAAIDAISQDASAASSPALKHVLSQVLKDLHSLRDAVSAGDLSGQEADLSSVGNDVTAIGNSCGV